MKKLFTSSFLMLMASSLLAQTVSVDEALQKAEKFLKRSGVATRADLPLKYSYTSAQGDETYYHVFNQGNNQGFIIVGGDASAQEILGYSDKGTFDYANMPENLRWWLGQYDNEISHAIREVKAGRGKIVKSVMTRGGSKSDVDYLLKTQWNQTDPYNSCLPSLGNGYESLVTGCVATAGAQVMDYYKYPVSGKGSNSYTKTWPDPIGTITFGANFTISYDWSNMLDQYNGTETALQKQAVGTLMYHVGVAVNMNYGQASGGGSGASTLDLGAALIKNFDYDQGMAYEIRDGYTDNAWEDLIYSELSKHRPVIYSGHTTQNEGHAFVCDGYRSSDNKFHINWGWGGLSDGYYSLSGANALLPDEQGTGGGSDAYTQDQSVLVGIQPNNGSAPVIALAKCHPYSLSRTSVTAGVAVEITSGYSNRIIFKNHSLCTENITYGVRLKSSSNVYDVEIDTEDFGLSSGPVNRLFTVPASVVAGTYQVIPIYKDFMGNWQQAKGDFSTFAPSLTVNAPTALFLSEDIKVSNGGYILADDFKITFKVKNPTAASKNTDLVLWVMKNTSGNDYSSVGYYEFEDTFAAGEEKSYTIDQTTEYVTGTVSAPAKYLLKLVDYDKQVLCNQKIIEVTAANPITYTLTSAGWGTLCLPYEAAVPSGLTAYTVTGTNGHSLVLEQTTTLEMNKPYLLEGTPGNYDFSGPTTPTGTYTNGLLSASTEADGYAPKYSFVVQNHEGKVGFYKVQYADSQPCRKYHAYLRVSSTASCFSLGGGEPGTTSLDEFESFDELQEVKAYDMYGRPVDPNAKGLVIINGVKRINK